MQNALRRHSIILALALAAMLAFAGCSSDDTTGDGGTSGTGDGGSACTSDSDTSCECICSEVEACKGEVADIIDNCTAACNRDADALRACFPTEGQATPSCADLNACMLPGK